MPAPLVCVVLATGRRVLVSPAEAKRLWLAGQCELLDPLPSRPSPMRHAKKARK